MLPVPSIEYIPSIFKKNISPELLAMTNKMDEHWLEWLKGILDLANLTDVSKCPYNFLDILGNYVAANILPNDDETNKRQKIANAIMMHKFRSTWGNDISILISIITGYTPAIFRPFDKHDWVLLGRESINEYSGSMQDFAILGTGMDYVESISLLGGVITTQENVWGVIYINLHPGIDTPILSESVIQQIINNIKLDNIPAYFIINLGYTDSDGEFVVYDGGEL
jgi:phage tail-like protein